MKMFPLFVIFGILISGTVHAGSKTDLVYRREDDIFVEICNDKGTGAHRAMTIWRPVTLQNGFYALGDVAVPNYEQPTTSAIMVKDKSGTALKPPTGFTEVWNDKGSGKQGTIRIMSMNCPDGYVSLGHVAISEYNKEPDSSQYRCVKEEFVTKGTYELIWNDKGSGSYRACTLWSNRQSPANTHGLDANTFTSFASYATPSDSPYMLDSRSVINAIDILVDDTSFHLTVYEVEDVEEMWNDKGSGAYEGISIWRSHGPSNTYSLGDIAVGNYRKPTGFVVKPHNYTDLRPPSDFIEIWNDAGSGADLNVDIWRPQCPDGFRALGHVVTKRHSTKPDTSSMRCVNETYTVKGDWKYVWKDAGSGVHEAVTIYTSLADSSGQGVGAMTSFKGYVSDSDITIPAFVLDASATYYIQGRPAVSYILRDVTYHFNDYLVLEDQPQSIKRATVTNKGSEVATIRTTVSYSYSEMYTWSNAAGGELGVELTVTAGIPFISSGEIATHATGNYEHEWGGNWEDTITDSTEVQLDTKPCCTKSAVVTGIRYKMDVPYTATLVTIYEDETQSVRGDYEGVFRGVEVNQVVVEFEDDIPIEGCVIH